MNVKYLKLFCLLLFNLTFSLAGCGQMEKKVKKMDSLKKVQNETIAGNFSAQLRIGFDSIQIDTFLLEYPKLKRYENDLRSFYRKRNFSYAWFEDGILIEQAGNLTNRLKNLEDEGIYKRLSYVNTLDSLSYVAGISSKRKKPNIKLELLLTSEYFVFFNLAWEGMNPLVSKNNNWFLPRKKIPYDLYLDSLLKLPAKDGSANEPVYRQYELLKTYLRKYRSLDAQLDWLPINKNASKDLVISQVKKRLFYLEDYQGELRDSLLDDQLNLALIRFQQRHGLDTSGLINKETIFELNVPIKTRIKQILVNMERSRWLPVTSKGDYLAVNIPAFKLHVYHDENILWSCNTVVGKTVHPTTLFYGEINQVVFSPYWNIPETIVAKEIIPGMRKSTNYLDKHEMEIIGQRNGLPIIRQRPGPSNSLGLVKFLFPNSYNIYLHDTPSKSLFNETNRAFSHGCIRIAEPAKLAAFLLKDDDKWNETTINLAMNSGKEKFVSLAQNVPVYITYFTAFVDRDLRLNFRKDIYKLDERLASMIISGDGAY